MAYHGRGRGHGPVDQPPATLLAARRIGDDPRAAFRAVSGLVLALFITTAAVVAITTQDAKDTTRFGTVAQSNLMTDQVAAPSPSGSRVTDPGRPRPPPPSRRGWKLSAGSTGSSCSGRTRR